MPDLSRVLDFAPATPACIVSFDEARVRPGLRALMREARLRLIEAKSSGAFCPDASACSPEFLIGLLPCDDRLFDLDDAVAAKRASDCAILALLAIQDRSWDRPEHLTFFMQLQSVATRLGEHPEVEASGFCKTRGA